MSDDLFSKRMNVLFQSPTNRSSTLGSKTAKDSIAVNEATFTNDPNYKRGTIYDWNMKAIDVVDFKFQKTKTHTVSNDEVEYTVEFRAGFNPEKRYKSLYYRDDGKERTGFYLDIEDEETGVMEKWLLCRKDDRIYFDRYLVLKCNWMFEWIDKTDNKYHRSLGCLREANSYTSGVWSDGISTALNDLTSFILPTNEFVANIDYGTRFMISDSERYPKVYEITKNLSTFPLGITKFSISQTYYNAHTDFCGKISDLKDVQLVTDDEITDLPSVYGGKYHMICNLIKSKLPVEHPQKTVESVAPSVVTWKLSDVDPKLVIGGNSQHVRAIPSDRETADVCTWRFYVDSEPYEIQDLDGYFDIVADDDGRGYTIKTINPVMNKYVLRLEIAVGTKIMDSVEMEVTL